MKRSYGDNPKIHYGIDKIQCMMPTLRSPTPPQRRSFRPGVRRNMSKSFPSVARPLAIALAVLALVSSASAEWKEKVLYSFQGAPDGSFPGGGVVFDKAGNLYGVRRREAPAPVHLR